MIPANKKTRNRKDAAQPKAKSIEISRGAWPRRAIAGENRTNWPNVAGGGEQPLPKPHKAKRDAVKTIFSDNHKVRSWRFIQVDLSNVTRNQPRSASQTALTFEPAISEVRRTLSAWRRCGSCRGQIRGQPGGSRKPTREAHGCIAMITKMPFQRPNIFLLGLPPPCEVPRTPVLRYTVLIFSRAPPSKGRALRCELMCVSFLGQRKFPNNRSSDVMPGQPFDTLHCLNRSYRLS